MKFDVQSPAYNAVAVTTSDSTVYAPAFKSLYVGGDGNVTVRMSGGNIVTFTNVQAGSYLVIQCDQVRATATTATGIVGLN
jgi:hypothetical protein